MIAKRFTLVLPRILWNNGRKMWFFHEDVFLYFREREKEQESLQLFEDVLARDVRTSTQKARLGYDLRKFEYFDSLSVKSGEAILKITSKELVSNPQSKQSKELLQLLPILKKSDVLLERDAKRFQGDHSKIKVVSNKGPSGALSPTYIRVIHAKGNWTSIANLGAKVSVAGSVGDLLTVAMLENTKCFSSQLKVSDFPDRKQTIYHVGLTSSTGAKARVFFMQEAGRLHVRSLNKRRTAIHEQIGGFQKVLALGSSGESGFIFVYFNTTGALILNEFDIDGNEVSATVLDLAPEEAVLANWSCAAKDQHACVSVGYGALWKYHDGQLATIQLHEFIHKVVFSPSSHKTVALLSGEQDVALVVPGKFGKLPEFINLYTATDKPFASFTNDGKIVIVGGTAGVVFELDKLSSPVATFKYSPGEGKAIDVCAIGAHGFAVLTAEAKIVVFEQ